MDILLFLKAKYYSCSTTTVLIFGQVVVVESRCQEGERPGTTSRVYVWRIVR